jgi:16S rRNA processing protein RimM
MTPKRPDCQVLSAGLTPMSGERHIPIGHVSGLYGVKGWVRIFSDTDPREKILEYTPWILELEDRRSTVRLAGGRRHGKGVVASIEGFDDRDAAAALVGARILLERAALPETPAGSYYWQDLTGLTVTNTDGEELGRVDSLIETGANDVMVVVSGNRRRLIPFVQPDVIRTVDLARRTMTVEWNAED